MSNTRRLLAACLVLGLPAGASAQPAFPPAVARAAERLEATWRSHGAPAFSEAVASQGRLVFSDGRGLRTSRTSSRPTGPPSTDIGSVSKVVTAVAVMQLVEQGKVRLDDSIRAYVPSFPDKGAPITIRHLMTHTSGIRHYRDDDFPGTPDNENVRPYTSLEAAIAIFRDDPLLFPPGKYVAYSSYAVNLLQGVVEKSAGLPFEEYLRRSVWGPAGMLATQFDVPDRVDPSPCEELREPKDGAGPKRALRRSDVQVRERRHDVDGGGSRPLRGGAERRAAAETRDSRHDVHAADRLAPGVPRRKAHGPQGRRAGAAVAHRPRSRRAGGSSTTAGRCRGSRPASSTIRRRTSSWRSSPTPRNRRAGRRTSRWLTCSSSPRPAADASSTVPDRRRPRACQRSPPRSPAARSAAFCHLGRRRQPAGSTRQARSRSRANIARIAAPVAESITSEVELVVSAHRQRIEVARADERDLAVGDGGLGVDHHAFPLVDPDARVEEALVDAPGRGAGERMVVAAGQQDRDGHAPPRGRFERREDLRGSDHVGVGDLERRSRARRRATRRSRRPARSQGGPRRGSQPEGRRRKPVSELRSMHRPAPAATSPRTPARRRLRSFLERARPCRASRSRPSRRGTNYH